MEMEMKKDTLKAPLVGRWQDFIQYSEGQRPSPQTMLENDRVRIIIAGLRPGQSIPVHPEAAAVYQFLEGQGMMTVDETEIAVQPGSVIVMSDGAKRGLKAETQLVFLAVRLA